MGQYLGLDASGLVNWCLIDDVNVPPSVWLKYDELALVYRALHEQRKVDSGK